ncbi:MAG: sugar phosphorylase [Candidatus Diapherotrites archaeon]|nr:sugar phosphorylase [Candidatus Diapherotrites archaeon]
MKLIDGMPMNVISVTSKEKIITKLCMLYGKEHAEKLWPRIERILEEYIAQAGSETEPKELFTEKDAVLITYPDAFYRTDEKPLRTLRAFLEKYLLGIINGVHILPFFPYSSDRGFSVIDFYQVKPELGTWQDIAEIGKRFNLMVDLIINHVSTQSAWFKKFLEDDPYYKNFFISFSKGEIPHSELAKVFRPRPTPVLTRFKTNDSERWVWTTFSVGTSTDQVDLNYKNPEVLLEMVKVLLFLLKNAHAIRLDAIAYIWKELGTNCIHRPQAHIITQLFRDILDVVKPSAILITETNVPHAENISYFGNGANEAQAVYNFSLPPLTLHAFWSEDTNYLSKWASSLAVPSDRTTFFNFLDSHDGIGILGARGILPEKEIEAMFEEVKKRGGELSYKANPDGTKSVYEMNITWWSALNNASSEPLQTQVQRFLCSRAIALALQGIPGIYYLSLFGCENDIEGMEKSGLARDINRTNLEITALEEKLQNKDAKEARVFWSLLGLIKTRVSCKAFHPNAEQKVLFLSPEVFALLRTSPDGKERILALHNVSRQETEVELPDELADKISHDIISNKKIVHTNKSIALEPYQVLWLMLRC